MNLRQEDHLNQSGKNQLWNDWLPLFSFLQRLLPEDEMREDFFKMLICFSESRLHPVSLLVSESGIANGAKVLSGPGLLLTAMFGCMAQQQPSSALRLWLMLQQGIIGTMHVEISGSV